MEKKLAVNSTTSFTKDLKIIGERFRIVNRNDKIRKIVKKGLTFSLCAVLVGGLAAGSFEGVNKLAGWDGAATVETSLSAGSR